MREIDGDRVVDRLEGPAQELAALTELYDPTDEQDWQERALCAQTDPEAFFPEKGGSTREAWSTPWRTMSASASGAACPNASGGSSRSAPCESSPNRPVVECSTDG